MPDLDKPLTRSIMDEDLSYRNYSFTGTVVMTDLIVYFHKPADWADTVRIHYWDAQPGGRATNWPGTPMTAQGDDWFAYRFEGVTAIKLVFNDNQGRQTSNLSREGSGYYRDEQWFEEKPAPLAPVVSAVTVVAARKNVRLLVCGELPQRSAPRFDYKRVTGGLLVQDADLALYAELRVVSRRQPTEAELRDLLFAWQVAKFVKSNAIVYARDNRTIGVGAGQMSRVNSARIAAIKAEQAGLAVTDAVMASDAFFPFRDGIDNAAAAGIRAVIQPGGSVRDDEVIAAADEHDMAMVFTGMRHFRH